MQRVFSETEAWPARSFAAGYSPADAAITATRGAVVALLSADQRIRLAEAELLRAVCGALHCPLPPLLQN